jgi:hypothetical protein
MANKAFQQLAFSRRRFLRAAGVATGATALLAAGASPAAADSRFSKSMAKYQATPKGAASCRICSQFQAPNACRVVAGDVSPTGWCLLFVPKS